MATFNPSNYYQPQVPVQPQFPPPPPQQQPVSLEAVGIHIYNPTVNAGGVGQAGVPSAYAMPQAPIYNMPQAPMYAAPQQPYAPAPFIPGTPLPPSNVANQVAPPPPAVIDQPAPPPVAAQPAPTPAPAPAPEQAAAPAPEQPTVAPTEAQQPVDPATVTAKLASPDPVVQGEGLFQLATACETNPAQTPAFLSDQTLQAVTDLMSKDTTQLQGPEKDKADTNKMNGMFAMAIVHKNLRDMGNAQGIKVPFRELPGITSILSNVKTDPNPSVRLAGISALSYAAQPEDKPDLEKVFIAATEDADPNVQAAATEALQLIGSAPAQQPEAPAKAA